MPKKITPKKKAVMAKVKVPRRVTKKDTLLRAVRAASARVPINRPHQLERHENNPIIEPQAGNYWEMKATFNPGALYADRRVHLLYRAIGGDDVSVLGYASSEDGVTFTDRASEPAYTPLVTKKDVVKEEEKAPLNPAYFSGGGWNGGCEDPRLTQIDEKVYLTYTAFDGWGSIRIALSSIGIKDFLDKNWKWKSPSMISPPGEINKNWVLFPEKIHGKFAILHSISPKILIDYFDDLDSFDDEENVITSRYEKISRTGAWDSWIRGAGPPPLKTELGWLLFYHAMDLKDPDRYKLGAMILDSNDPTKIIYRSQTPILEPDFSYENQGFKAGVVYSCGAIIKDGELFVYYGGGDSVVCVAMANLKKFLHELEIHGAPKLEPEPRSKVNPKPKRNA
jgi:predicted GH43/DUF377 family glycosyl hydrolase